MLYFGLWLIITWLVPSLGHASPEWPNEPANATNVIDCGFDTPLCAGQLLDPYNTVAFGTLSTRTDATAPLSPSNVLRSTMFLPATTGGTELHYDRAPVTEMFVGMWWRSNPTFSGNGVGANKLFFLKGRVAQNGAMLWQKPVGSTLSRFFFITQLPYNGDQCYQPHPGDVDQCYPNGIDVPIVPGNWYRIEVYIKASTCATCHDGILRWWITPKGGSPSLAANFVNFAYGPDLYSWVWSETWDGGGNAQGFTSNPEYYLDHLHISIPNCPSGCSVTPVDNPAGPPGAVVLSGTVQ